MSAISALPPGTLLIAGALLLPLLRGAALKVWLLALPLLSFFHQLYAPEAGPPLQFFGMELVLLRADPLALAFGVVFHLAALLAALYALQLQDRIQHAAGLFYAGAAIAALFAGDLITLFIFWEFTALSSVLLIWARRSARARHAGFRYLVVQVGSGVLLLAGAALHYRATGSLSFGALDPQSPGGALILLAFGVKAAFPLLHNWLQDAYPEATVTGTVFLSAFTTKLAIYALARGFAGTELLIPIGVTMTIFPIFYAVIENDLRRVLAYSLNNQLGYMVVGIGVGTPLALSGAVAHAFSHIIYKSLLFMAMGAVLLRAGRIGASQLGGLYRSMPWTTAFCIVGVVSISGLPLFNGFISKSLIFSAVAEQHHAIAWAMLIIASASVLKHLKVPYFAFFAGDSGLRVREAPLPMLLAMGAAAAACLFIGVWPQLLYGILPHPVNYQPYTAAHVIGQLQLLFFAVLAFALLLRFRLIPPELRAINLDADWLYRRALPAAICAATRVQRHLRAAAQARAARLGHALIAWLRRHHAPPGRLGEPWSAGATALWAALLLAASLLLFYLRTATAG